jgi:ribosomal protein L13
MTRLVAVMVARGVLVRFTSWVDFGNDVILEEAEKVVMKPGKKVKVEKE